MNKENNFSLPGNKRKENITSLKLKEKFFKLMTSIELFIFVGKIFFFYFPTAWRLNDFLYSYRQAGRKSVKKCQFFRLESYLLLFVSLFVKHFNSVVGVELFNNRTHTFYYSHILIKAA